MKHRVDLVLSTVLALAACGSTPNRRVDAPLDRPLGRPAEPVSTQPARNEPASERPVPTAEGAAPSEAQPVAAQVPTTGGKGATPPPADAPPEAAGDGPHDVVAVVAGAPLYAADLLSAWMHRDSNGMRATLEELILSRLVLVESGRLGIRVRPDLLERARGEVLKRVESEVQKSGGGLSTRDFIQRRLGLDPDLYLARLARETEIDLLAERVVRSWMLAADRAEVRVIVVDQAQARDEVRRRLDAGERFEDLADELSIEKSGAAGGRIPPVVRGEAALARLAFSTPVGEVGGPVFEEQRWLFLKVDDRPAPVRGDWPEVGAAVEESLGRGGIEDPEYWQWKADVLRRYEVDMEPLLGLTGQPKER